MVNNYTYDEWGNILESNETISNPFKYAGEVYDEETGLYYLRARYYDPSTGRFLNEDTVEGQIDNPLSLNLYTYCYNNPLIYLDPTGNTAQDFLMGMGDVLFAGIDNTFVRWILGQFGLTIKDYKYESAVDYYAGRVVGDVLLMIGSTGGIIKGVGTIMASVGGGAALTVGSGGTLALGGWVVVAGGVAVGSAEVAVGAAVLSAAAGNFGDDLNKLMDANKVAGKGNSKGGHQPSNLKEQLAVEEAMSNPAAGRELKGLNNDPRWPKSEGWIKMAQNINGVEVHYEYNPKTGLIDDIKIK